MSIDKDVPRTLYGDSFRPEQVLINLITNAVKFTEHGEIVVLASLASNSEDNRTNIFFSVKDTGIGISQCCKNKILFGRILRKNNE